MEVKKISEMTKRRPCLFNLSILLAALVTASCTKEEKRETLSSDVCTSGKKNIVLYISDDHSMDTGAYGNPVIQTPNLDAFAAEGVRFTKAYATTASCSASRSVIFTGMHNHRTGQYGHVHDYNHFYSFDHIQSVSRLLADNGYRTARTGKFHVAPDHVYPYDEVLPGNDRNPAELARNSKEFIVSDNDQPFFLLIGTSDPHRGGGRATELPYQPDRFGNRPEGWEGIDPVVYDPQDVIVPEWLPDNDATRQELAQYYQSVSRLDQGFGKLIDILKESGNYDNTLVIYMSDHGMAFPGAKTTVYEPGLLSPLIVRDPCATRQGVVNEAMISWVDITPTILDYAGIEPPVYERHIGQGVIRDYYPEQHGLHGRSFRPVLEESNPEGWDKIYASHTFHEIHMFYPMRVVRDRDYKLIWNINYVRPYPFASDLKVSSSWSYTSEQGPETPFGARTVDEYVHRDEFELFDMQQDPEESNNLAGDPEYADILEDYIEQIREFQRQTGDPWYIHWVYDDMPAAVHFEEPVLDP